MKNTLSFLLAFLLLALASVPAGAAADPPAQAAETIVLTFLEDPYASLAEEIAGAEGLPLAHSWDAALAENPLAILWVAAPGELSDVVMAAAGMALKKHTGLPAVGIISGVSLEEARQLWQRGRALVDLRALEERRAGDGAAADAGAPARCYAANGEFPTAGIPAARLIDFQADPPQTSPMDRSTLVGALEQADYLTFTGHGSDDYLRLNDDTKLSAGDIPALPPLVVSTGSCQTMRIWNEGSIALGFTHQGAAAYAGFVYSPMEGYLIGSFQDLPFRYAWPEFPIGQIAALQTRGSMQGYANFPFHYLLGDPRIALQSAPPYSVSSDEVSGGVRTITLQGAPQGLIPVRVRGGAAYAFVEAPGLAATADGDPFFNARIQAASLGGDKYILIKHTGGDLTLRLREKPPFLWLLIYPLTAAFDHVALFTPQNGGDALLLVAAAPALLIVLLRWAALRKRARKQALSGTGAPVAVIPFLSLAVPAAASGLAAALLLGLYQALRLPHAAITTKPLTLEPLWLVGVFLLTAAGCCLFLLGRSWPAKLFALLVAASPALLPGLFVYLYFGIFNLLAGQQMPARIYNNNMGSLPLAAAGLWLIVSGIAFWRIEKGQRRLRE